MDDALGSRQRLQRPQARLVPNPKLRLQEQVREVMRFKQFSRRTEEAYGVWIRQFILFQGKRHPQELGKVEIEVFFAMFLRGIPKGFRPPAQGGEATLGQ